jgi:ribonuclease R
MATDRELLDRIRRSPGSRAGYKQLVRELGLGGGRERRLLLEQLARMTAAGALVQAGRDHWSPPQAAAARDNLVAGRLDLHRDGYGFVRPNKPGGSRSKGGEEDIFVPPAELHGAMQGDQVLVEVAQPRAHGPNAGRLHGRVVRILTRRNPTVVGRFQYATTRHSQGNHVVPFDERMTQPILIPFGLERPEKTAGGTPHRVLGSEARRREQAAETDLDGMVVDVEITDWPTPTRPARGRVIEVLGSEDDFGVDVEIVIRKHHLPHIFPENVLAEARGVARLDPVEAARRRDFRGLPIVTIDGETARDFDDAVLVRELDSGGYELQVHIADVAQYVTEGSALDLEARVRGTSVYFPDRAVPMLPQELSTDICSLRPDEGRLVLSCIMQLDASGHIRGYEVCEGIIRSARRMTYTQVHAILSGDNAARDQFAPLVPEFERMYALARILNKKRERRGSIDFDLPEPVIEFNEQGLMQSIVRSDRTWANRLIEEFMLSANECVASWLETLDTPSLYRIHEKPDPRRVVEFEETAATFGYSLGFGALPVKRVQFKADRREHHRRGERGGSGHRGGRGPRTHEIPEDIPVTPQMYQRLAEKIAGKPEERILSYLMLRSLKQARYSEQNEGHFALAAPTYTHFTSPIRRYPDLIVHRVSKALLRRGVSGQSRKPLKADDPHGQKSASLSADPPHRPAKSQDPRLASTHVQGEPPISEDELAAIGRESSEAERRAADAERELIEWKKVKFMQDRIGEDFNAMVLSPTRYGLFVELDDLFIEGLVPIESLGATSRDGDRYTFREDSREIAGLRHGKRYRIGDRLRVVLDRVDTVERRLQFSILEEEAPPAGPSKAKAKAKTKAKAATKAAPPPAKPARKARGTARKPKRR